MNRRSFFFPFCVAMTMIASCTRSSSTAPSKATEVSEAKDESGSVITITDRSQRDAAVDKNVVVIGIQTRTKQPQVNGVDVDGDYELSEKKVVARGILRKTVVPELPPPEDGVHVASRGPGTYYAVIDPETKQIAKTKLAE